MSVQLEKTVDRRRVVKGAAWSVPAVIAAGAVPAQAVSPGKNANATTGLYVTVARTNGATGVQLQAEMNNILWTGPTSEPDVNWDDARGCSNAVPMANGEGIYTPHGTLSSLGKIGGTGFWLSSPQTPDGRPASGTATLGKGAQFAIDYIVLRPGGPRFNTTSKARPWAFRKGTSEVRSDEPTPYRPYFNQVKSDYAPSGPDRVEPVTINGVPYNKWTGTILFTTKADLVAEGPNEKYAQIDLSRPSVTVTSGDVYGFRATVRPVSGTIVTNSNGKRTTTQLTDAVQSQTAYWVPCNLKGAV